MKLKNNTAGLALGGLVAFAHLVWSLLVMFGWAESWLSFVLGLHFLNNPYTVDSFSIGTSSILIILTGVIGYALGWVFAWIWNMLHK